MSHTGNLDTNLGRRRPIDLVIHATCAHTESCAAHLCAAQVRIPILPYVSCVLPGAPHAVSPRTPPTSDAERGARTSPTPRNCDNTRNQNSSEARGSLVETRARHACEQERAIFGVLGDALWR